MKNVSTLLVCCAIAFAAEIPASRDAVDAGSNSEYRGTVEEKQHRRSTFIGTTDRMFPHFAVGGGEWETIMVLVNMSSRRIDFTQEFHGTDGALTPVTFRSVPEGTITTASTTRGFLGAGASLNVLLVGAAGEPLKTGWASLDYDANAGRIGGYMIFRRRTPSGTYETLVPLSPYDDYKFYLPIDNLEGFQTALALANPAPVSTRIQMTFLDKNGNAVDRTAITLPASGQMAFVLSERFPGVAGRIGTLYVEGSTDRLSAIGLRFNPAGAFASVPILNWPAMFP